MHLTIADLKKGEKGIITDSSSKDIPSKTFRNGMPSRKQSAFTSIGTLCRSDVSQC